MYYTQGKYEDTLPVEMETNDIRSVLKKLAEYEDLEEQGLLHKAPLKDGTPIYWICTDYDEEFSLEYFVEKEDYVYNITEYHIGEFGKDFWATKEEAEQALAEMEKEK